MQYLTLTIDKSALQSLSASETKWLCHHFRLNLSHVFFAEVIADLTKRRPTTGTSEGDVAMLARKIPSHAVHINVNAIDLMRAELRHGPIPMDGRIADESAEEFVTADGRRGLVADATPTQDMMARWCKGDFSELERDFAREWREGIDATRLEEVFRKIKHMKTLAIKTPADVLSLVDREILKAGREFDTIQILFSALALPEPIQRAVLHAWRRAGRPPVRLLFPYGFYVLRIEFYFLIGLANGIVGTRDSNRIDIEYLKYMSFAHAFCSSDALHFAAAPLFVTEHNCFVRGTELKAALREIAEIWEARPDETKRLGTATYANFPPPECDNVVTRIYDKFIPDWRVGANQPRPKIDPAEEAKIMAELRPMMEAMEARRKQSPQ